MSSMTISATGIEDANLRMAAASHGIANFAVSHVGDSLYGEEEEREPVLLNDVSSEARAGGQGVKTTVGTRESVFGVDLVSEVLNLKLATESFKANVRALQVTDSAIGTIIDLVDSKSAEKS